MVEPANRTVCFLLNLFYVDIRGFLIIGLRSEEGQEKKMDTPKQTGFL